MKFSNSGGAAGFGEIKEGTSQEIAKPVPEARLFNAFWEPRPF